MSKIRQKDFKIFGFSDNIFYEKIGKKWFSGGKVLEQSFGHFAEISPLKLFIFYPLVVLILFILLGRLFMLTIVNGEKNRQIAESNRIRLVEIPAERGKIFDRRGAKILRENSDKFYRKLSAATQMAK
ncbi:MAG: Penicillin-binding protein 2 [Candidatus Curtissbacteria bacterium GW2011_GWA2_41_24]|uniref:Penicillin-binding protein 2 n=1 Tax=Candidatus Curtissbacteria bacterium GW2011_GWA2_41_24 TaxID=1618411 RepID=A0A0G0Y684_9BACT|nr:MAG: Penicillin-binding protein 2 [Candidatus Curtissbacteria bacterium GW2011_GWA2_41_24]